MATPTESPADIRALNGQQRGPDTGDARTIALIEGTTPRFVGETASLLRLRLQAAALAVVIVFIVLFVYRQVLRPEFGSDSIELLYSRITVILSLAGCALLLRRKAPIRLKWLRVYELVIFGLPVVYLALRQREIMMHFTEGTNLPAIPSSWVSLIYIYALFIPNTWRRAAVVLGALAATPLVLTSILALQSDRNGGFLGGILSYLGDMFLLLGLAYATSLYGAHMINRLRREAFEARQLGQYRLCRLLGTGGMGEVYLAEHQMMKRPCAIKVIRPGKAADPQALARFEREVRATARLTHWNTIEIFDYGRTEDGTFYYVMEYLPGLSLAELVERHGPLDHGRTIHLLQQACDGLAEAHSSGLIHRDIKPSNIFAAHRGGVHDVAKVLDFGLAKRLMTSEDGVDPTQAGSIIGSPLYMSPEQALGDIDPDVRSDIYSLGVVGYFLLTGRPPFVGPNALKVIFAHLQESVPPLSTVRPDIPQDLEAVILRCLAKKPCDRYQSALELAAALAECNSAGSWTRARATEWWLLKESETKVANSIVPAEECMDLLKILPRGTGANTP